MFMQSSFNAVHHYLLRYVCSKKQPAAALFEKPLQRSMVNCQLITFPNGKREEFARRFAQVVHTSYCSRKQVSLRLYQIPIVVNILSYTVADGILTIPTGCDL